jgi:microcystin degradation protein MlrC
MQESNCLSPVQTTMEDFESVHFIRGAALLEAARPEAHEVPGIFKNAELTGVVDEIDAAGAEPVPILSTWSMSGGPLEKRAFDELCGRLDEGLRRAGQLDGVVLALHGAMGVDGVPDPDTEILRVARLATGGRARITATHDLHANLTAERVAACDAIVGYRTNPHRDHRRTGRTAARALLAALRGTARPTTAWRSLPMILGGGSTLDFLPPVRPIFSRLAKLHADPRVVSASVFMVHPWNDDPRLGWSTAVTTDGAPDLADELADELAERCWRVRTEMPPELASASEAIASARRARVARALGTVVFADASDVVTAGAPGENTLLLAKLLTEGRDLTSYVPLRDPVAVGELWAKPEGARVRVSVGGKLDPSRGAPLEVEGRILTKHVHGGMRRMVALDLGPVKLVLTEGFAVAVKPSFYTDVGLSPWRADVVVVKNFFPFLLYFAPVARKVVYVRTRGTTDFDAAYALPFDGPVWPRDPVADWRPADARRRGLRERAAPASSRPAA